MSMPGFKAEASFYGKSGHYRMRGPAFRELTVSPPFRQTALGKLAWWPHSTQDRQGVDRGRDAAARGWITAAVHTSTTASPSDLRTTEGPAPEDGVSRSRRTTCASTDLRVAPDSQRVPKTSHSGRLRRPWTRSATIAVMNGAARIVRIYLVPPVARAFGGVPGNAAGTVPVSL